MKKIFSVITALLLTAALLGTAALAKEIDGTEYDNIAIGKTYTTEGAMRTDGYGDYAEDGTTCLYKLTNGVTAVGSTSDIAGYSSDTTIVLDLGSVSKIREISADLIGGFWGLASTELASVEFLVSSDGVTFTTCGVADVTETTEEMKSLPEGGDSRLFSVTLDTETNARYIKVMYSTGGSIGCWSSEISVYGVEGTPSDDESIGEPADVSGEKIDVSVEEGISDAPQASDTATEETDGNSTWIIVGVCAGVIIVAAVIIVIVTKKK